MILEPSMRLEHVATHAYILYQPNCQAQGYERGPPVTYERQRNSHHRKHSDHHADVDQSLPQNERAHSNDYKGTKPVP